jgi:hypothetical protein
MIPVRGPASVRLVDEDAPVMAEVDSTRRHGDRRHMMAFALVGLVIGIGVGVGLGAATRPTPASATAARGPGGSRSSPTTTAAPGTSGNGLTAVHGTVMSLTGQRFELREPGGIDVTVVLTEKTHFGNKNHTDGEADLSGGSRVVVHGMTSGSTLTAKRVVIVSSSG